MDLWFLRLIVSFWSCLCISFYIGCSGYSNISPMISMINAWSSWWNKMDLSCWAQLNSYLYVSGVPVLDLIYAPIFLSKLWVVYALCINSFMVLWNLKTGYIVFFWWDCIIMCTFETNHESSCCQKFKIEWKIILRQTGVGKGKLTQSERDRAWDWHFKINKVTVLSKELKI